MKVFSVIVAAVALTVVASQANAAKRHHHTRHYAPVAHHTAPQARIAGAFAAFTPTYAYAPVGLATLDFGACAHSSMGYNGNPDSICNRQNGFNR